MKKLIALAVLFGVLILIMIIPITAFAEGDTGQTSSAGVGGVGGVQDQLQQWLNVAVTAAVTGALGWMTVHVGPKIKQWFGAKGEIALQQSKDWLADHAIAYADEQEHKLGSKLDGTTMMKHAQEFLAKQGIVGDAARAAISLIEARLNKRRDDLMKAAQAKLAANAMKLEDALKKGPLADNIKKIEAQQDAAIAKAKAEGRLP